MSEIERIYRKLSEITLDKFDKQKLYLEDKLFLDMPETINFDIEDYPVERLLAVRDSEEFIRECFFKIFDRPVDNSSFYKLLQQLNAGKISRIKLIRKLYSSYEREIRNTGLNFANLDNT